MNRATRDKFTATTNPKGKNSRWETAPAVYRQLNKDFGPFDLDLTADPKRHLCKKWLGPGVRVRGAWIPGSTIGRDALAVAWHKHGRRGYSNPPYGRFVPAMLKHARAEAAHGFTTVLLLPLRANAAFREEILGGATELLFCDRRLVFFENGRPRRNRKTGAADCALFDSIVVVFGPGRAPRRAALRVGIWHVPADHGK